MRTLPVYILVDVSESMIGATMRQLEDGLMQLSDTLKTVPEALETAKVSIIAFAGKPKVLVPLVEVAHLYPPRLPVGGGTSLGKALELLMDRIDKEVAPTTAERKGDWKPIVFLMTDGVPTDNPGPAIERWKRDYARRASLVSISVGGRADLERLREISEKVLILNYLNENAITSFITWVTQSIAIQSQSIGAAPAEAGVNLSKTLPNEMEEDDGVRSGLPDDRYVVIVGKCEKNELPYLLKFERGPGPHAMYDFSSAQAVGEEYFELCGDDGGMSQISTGNLNGGCSCPHCPNEVTMAHCSKCDGIHCLSLREGSREGGFEAICPWCGSRGLYGSAGPGREFDLNRGLG